VSNFPEIFKIKNWSILLIKKTGILTRIRAGIVRNHGSITDRVKSFVSAPECPYRLCDPASHLFSGYLGSFPGVKVARG